MGNGTYDLLPNDVSKTITTVEPVVLRAIERYSAASGGLDTRMQQMRDLIMSSVSVVDRGESTECWLLTTDYLDRHADIPGGAGELRRRVMYGILAPIMIGIAPREIGGADKNDGERIRTLVSCLGHTRCTADCIRPDHLYYRDSADTNGIKARGLCTIDMLSIRLGMRPSGPKPSDPDRRDRNPSLAMVRGTTEDRGDHVGYRWIAKDREGYAGRYATRTACAAVLYDREWLRRNPDGEELILDSRNERGATGHRRSRAMIERDAMVRSMFGLSQPATSAQTTPAQNTQDIQF